MSFYNPMHHFIFRMQRVQIATVGKSPEPVIDGFRRHSVDQLILLHSPETLDVASDIKRRVEDLSGHKMCNLVEIDAFEMRDIVAKLVGAARRFPESQIRVNITGGTNVMAAAALVACFTLGASAFYVKESVAGTRVSLAESVVELPVPRVSIESLDENQSAILRELGIRGGTLRKANVSLRDALGIAPQLVSYHLRELRKKRLIDLHLEGREKTASLTDSGLLFAELIRD